MPRQRHPLHSCGFRMPPRRVLGIFKRTVVAWISQRLTTSLRTPSDVSLDLAQRISSSPHRGSARAILGETTLKRTAGGWPGTRTVARPTRRSHGRHDDDAWPRSVTFATDPSCEGKDLPRPVFRPPALPVSASTRRSTRLPLTEALQILIGIHARPRSPISRAPVLCFFGGGGVCWARRTP